MKKKIAILMCMLLALGIFCLIGCNSGGEQDPTPNEGYKYEITVKTDTGKHLFGVTVEIIDANGKFLDYGITDANGKFTSKELYLNEITVKLYEVQAGYKVEENYKISDTVSTILLKTQLLEAESLEGKTYKVGDIINDFTLTDKNGNEHTLSQLLTDKKAVVLNFWYNTCKFCLQEFPGLDEAYIEYNDKIELLAINSVDKVFTDATNGLSFPLLSDTIGIENAFASGYSAWANPATIVIDRFGVVSFIHIGALNKEEFSSLLDFYTGEEYIHTEFSSYYDFESALN